MKKIFFGLIFLVALLGVVEMTLQSSWAKEIAKNLLMEKLAEEGFSVHIEKIEGSFPSAIVLKNISFESNQVSIAIESLEGNLSLLSLLNKELKFTQLQATGIVLKEKEKGTIAQAPSKKETSFGVKINHFKLKNLSIPHLFTADFEGKFSLTPERSLNLNTTVRRLDFPESLAQLDLKVKPNGRAELKAQLDTSTLKALNISAPFDAKANIQLNMEGTLRSFLEKKGTLQAKIKGKITPRSTQVSPLLKDFIEEPWFFSTILDRGNEEIWTISRFNAKSETGSLQASGQIHGNGDIQRAALKIQSNIPNINIQIALESIDRQLQGKAVIRSPLLTIGQTTIRSLGTNTNFSWDGELLKGNVAGSLELYSKIWTGKSDFSWDKEKKLSLPAWDLRSASIDLNGNLEIQTNQIVSAQAEIHVGNLQDVNSEFYGSLAAKTKWNEEQQIEIDGKVSDFYWKDLFTPSISFYLDMKHPFEKAEGNIYLDTELLKWGSLFLETTTLEIQSDERGFYPFKLFAEGEWIHPLELRLTGFFDISKPNFLCTVEQGSGSFFKHPLKLSHEVTLEKGSNLFLLPSLDLDVAKGHLSAQLLQKEEETKVQLTLENFPLDILSLNPLDLAIGGNANLQMNLLESKQAVSGDLKIAINQLEINSLEDSAPLSASGFIEGKFNNERLDFKGNINTAETPLLSCNLSIPIHLELWPFKSALLYEEKVKGDFAFDGKIEELLDFFDLGTSYLKGDCRANFHISQTLGKPHLKGYCNFENGYYENYFTGMQIRDIKASWRGEKGKLILESMSGKDGKKKGRLQASGEISLQHDDLFPFYFDVDFHRFSSVQIDLIAVESNGQLRIEGNLKNAVARGEIEVVESELSIPSRIPRSYPKLEVVYLNQIKPTITPRSNSTTAYPLILDVSVQAPDSIFIGGRGLDSEWKGDFKIDGTTSAIGTKGNLELIKGNFLLSGRLFKLTEGSLSFSGKPDEMPRLNLTASIDVKDVLITAQLKGPLNDPQITLQSTPPLPLSTIMAYLLFGQNLAEINSYQALQLANSIASLAGEGPDVLENTRRSLGVDRLTIVTTPNKDDDDPLSDKIALQVGKYISEGILVSFSQGAEYDSTNISIEIEMKNGFVFQLESDQQQAQGKFTLKWNHNY